MVSCGALERSKNPYIESIEEPCVSKTQKEILATWVWLKKKSWKRAEAMEKKSIHELNVEFANFCVCVRERKNNSFEITVIIFKT